MNEDLFDTKQFLSTGSIETSNFVISGDGWGITPNGTTVTMKKTSKMPTTIFFKLMKKKMGILQDYSYKKRIEKITKAVEEAEKQGQIAFSEELLKKLLVLCREAELYAMNKRIFIDRSIFEQFKNKTERPVALTALKNYARPIPKDVLKEKEKCDKAKIFDGYAVMHYDGKGVVKETEKDKKEKREKDPILFGVIQYSDRLYFIADWEDEFCDLTLDDIIDKLNLTDADITLDKKIEI
jgi:transcriptional antiterminator